MNKPIEPKTDEHQVERRVTINGDGQTDFYSNHAGIQISPFDVKLQFGVFESVSEEAIEIRNTVGIYMSHKQLRLFYDLLSRNMERLAERAAEVDPES